MVLRSSRGRAGNATFGDTFAFWLQLIPASINPLTPFARLIEQIYPSVVLRLFSRPLFRFPFIARFIPRLVFNRWPEKVEEAAVAVPESSSRECFVGNKGSGKHTNKTPQETAR